MRKPHDSPQSSPRKVRPIDPAAWPAYRRELGRLVRDRRLEAGISRAHLADAIGCARRTITMIETGIGRGRGDARSIGPGMAILFRIAQGLGISVNELVP